MLSELKFRKLTILYLYLIIGVTIIICYPKNVEIVLLLNYFVSTTAYFIMTGLLISRSFKNKIDIFEPIVFISLIYILMFSIVPIIDIATGEILWFGVNLYAYGVKGTIIAVLGYIFFFFGYTFSSRDKPKNKKNHINNTKYNTKIIILSSLIGWAICFFLSIVYISATGMNLAYIFTLGVTGDVEISQISATPIGFISMFSYSLIPTSLIYSNYGKSKILKSLLFFGTLMIQLIRGFRFIVVILILSYIYFFYLKKEKRPSLRMISVTLIMFIFLIGLMGFYRESLRTGNIVAWDEFAWEDINEALFGNFRIYKTFFAVIKAVPSMTPHMYGNQMIVYTLIMFIPRALWSGKPNPPGGAAIELGISKYAAMAGQAYPAIGEFYYEFGIIGVLFFMFVFGSLMGNLKEKYISNKGNNFGLMSYSILVPTTLQLMIRGYTPSNFYLVIFLILPIMIIKRLSRKNKSLNGG